MAMNKVKINSDVELKDRLVAINRQSSLSVTATVSLAGDLARQVKLLPPSQKVLRQLRRIW